MIAPDTVPGYCEVDPIDRAILMKEYREALEREIVRVNAVYESECKAAVIAGYTKTQEWKLVVKYASGVSSKPDVDMLHAEYPDQYNALFDEQFKKFKPKMTKADLKWLFLDEEERAKAEAKILVNHPVTPQYLIMQRGAEE